MCSPASRKKTEELNRQILPPDVKVRPFYDRSDLVRVTTDTVEGNLLRGMALVLLVLIFFLVSTPLRSSRLLRFRLLCFSHSFFCTSRAKSAFFFPLSPLISVSYS